MYSVRHFVLLILVVFCGQASFAQCKAKNLVKENKEKLGEYKYDSYVLNEVMYGENKETIESEFSCYAGLKYKIIFCAANLKQNIGITVYDKPKTSKKRNILFFDESGKDSYFANFAPTKTGTYYVEYAVPAATSPNDKSTGCIVMLVGIKEK